MSYFNIKYYGNNNYGFKLDRYLYHIYLLKCPNLFYPIDYKYFNSTQGIIHVIEKEEWDKYKKKEDEEHQQREDLLREFERIRATQELQQEQQQQQSPD